MPITASDEDDRADRRIHRGAGKERHGEAQEAERAELEHDAREDHRARRRRLDVRVGQPGVEREHRHLHGEREEEGAEEPVARPSA